MFKKFIERPVMATVISILLVILGIIGLFSLPLQQFPDIAPPAVQVTALYPGANAETVLRSVAPSLEESINGVENMSYMSSTASNDGSLVISVYFKLGTNADQAAVNVQNRVAQATSQLPAEVVQAGVTTSKQQNSLLMVVDLYADSDKVYDQTFLANYAQINIIPEIKRIQGVGQSLIFGGNKDYSMRVWLNPGQMAAYHLMPQDVMAAIQDKNLEAAPGKFGESSKESFEYIIKYKGKLNQPKDYEDIVIRANPDGSMLRLKDVARVEFGAYTYGNYTRTNGKPGVNIASFQLAGSNSDEIQTAIGELMKKVKKSFPKGINYTTIYDTKIPLDESIDQVKHTLLEAFILVFIVVFIFLQDFRSTLIPAIAVPVAIIGTFFFMQIFGLSINLFTLFALVLAIGIVVDDAIVVVEAVHAKMEHKHLPPKAATVAAMSEITGAIISITLVMSAVFLPVGFMKGSTGVFYRQFAFTLAIAIVISAVNALTLSPALCALFLKEIHSTNEDGSAKKLTFKEKFFTGFNSGFAKLTNKYTGSLKFLMRAKWIVAAGLIIVTASTVWMVEKTKTGFIPSEDLNFFAIALSMPPGASLDRTTEVIKEGEKVLSGIESKRAVMGLSGFNILTQSSNPSAAVAFVSFKPMQDRGKIKDINVIMNDTRQKLAAIKGGNFFVFTFPTVPGFSNVDGLDLILQDRSGNGTLNKFASVSTSFIGELMKRKEIAFAFTSFKSDYPQLELQVDNEKAQQLGVSVKDILSTMQAYFGSAQASDFNRFGKYYRVMVQADFADRANPSAINNIAVKNKNGEMVPISTLVKLNRVYGPETVSRYNLFNSIEINAIPKPGYSSGDAIKAVEEVAQQNLPIGYTYEFTGLTKEEISSGGQSALIFALCLVFVYFLLSAQYESYILPMAVILSIPAGILGVFIAIGLVGIENNIYVQVAMVMLIGLLAKNAILIVEFAVQRRRAGKTLISSALEAAKLRLRPIIMTSLAFIVGMIPMMRAEGPSAQGNHSISIAAAGGMISGVILGLFSIPILFVVFQYLQESVTGKPKRVINKSDLHLQEIPQLELN
jgi:HAE1 family hydrophobic/amphiphilic exporter-1